MTFAGSKGKQYFDVSVTDTCQAHVIHPLYGEFCNRCKVNETFEDIPEQQKLRLIKFRDTRFDYNIFIDTNLYASDYATNKAKLFFLAFARQIRQSKSRQLFMEQFLVYNVCLVCTLHENSMLASFLLYFCFDFCC